MRLKSPPVVGFDNLPTVDIEKFLNYCLEFDAIDQKGRYLCWEDFGYRNPQDTELKWIATKFNRQKNRIYLQFADMEISFCLPHNINALLHQIDKMGGGFIGTPKRDGFRSKDQNVFLVHSLSMEEAISSAQLEGASTTRRIAKDMLLQARKPKNHSEKMILNNYQLMRLACDLKDEPLTIDLILRLHETATEGAIDNHAIPGSFRTSNDIFISNGYGEIIHTPPDCSQIQDLMNALIDFANRNEEENETRFIHPVLKAIIIHFMLSHIHPFGDGNGRTARALFYWYLLKNGYWLFEYLSISKHLLAAPKQYAKAFVDSQQDGNDVTYFLYHQLHVIIKSMNDLQSYIAKKQNELQDISALAANFSAKNNVKFNQRQLQILKDALQKQGVGFSSKQISAKYGISDNTARKDLMELRSMGLLGAIKDSKTTVFVAVSRLLEILEHG